MFTMQNITAYTDVSSFEKDPAADQGLSLEEVYLKAAGVDQHPREPEKWDPRGLTLGITRAPRKSLFLFYLAAHELSCGDPQNAFLHTVQGLMSMENLPDLPEPLKPPFRLLFLTLQILYRGPFTREIGEVLIEGLTRIPLFGTPQKNEEELLDAAGVVASRLSGELEMIPRTAKRLEVKLLSS
jgi:hypothetical protein